MREEEEGGAREGGERERQKDGHNTRTREGMTHMQALRNIVY